MIIPFADIETAAEIRVPPGIRLDFGNCEPLRKVIRRILRGCRRDAENNRQDIASARNFVQRQGNLITGVKAQIETQNGLHRGDGAGEVFLRFRYIQNGGIVTD